MVTNYKAVQVGASATFEHVLRSLREPAESQVRIAVEACGVCHSDAVGVYNLLGTRSDGEAAVPGHEIVGRIEALGAGVTDWAVGDRVGLGYLGGHCGVCDNCRRGDFVFCTDQPAMGDGFEGGYAEYVTARATGLVRLPEGVDATILAPLMCAGLTVFNGLRNSQARAGDLVAIQGIGGLGHLGVQYAKAMGYRVAAIARGAAKKQLALELGADYYIDSAAEDPAAALQALGGANVILATASHGGSMSGLINGLTVRGQLVIVGAAEEPVEVSTTDLVFGGRSIKGSLTGTPADNEQNVAFALQHHIAPMIERAPLENAEQSFSRMMAGDARFRIVLEVADRTN